MCAATDWWLFGVEAGVAVGTILLALMAYLSIKSNEQIVREQNKPYLSLMYDQAERKSGKISIPLHNTGRTAAMDVNVIVSNERGDEILKTFNFIPPGGSIPIIIGRLGTRTIYVSYYAEWSNPLKPTPYKHQWKMDIGEDKVILIV